MDGKQVLDRLDRIAGMASGLIAIGAHFLVFETQTQSFIAQPAGGARLSVTQWTGQQQAAHRSAAEFSNPSEVLPIQITNSVLAKDIEVLNAHRRRRFAG